ncbi:PrcB C-terminal [Alkalispirochaeta americana]|uniref:PrcB C-terminal n=2 Tax=Alkalispirochaeta americana TaxID=159291 RepID=A0A1N6SE18_9SPIO|nr:PrcB C-terminal [Alkalispirochaeta americana]
MALVPGILLLAGIFFLPWPAHAGGERENAASERVLSAGNDGGRRAAIHIIRSREDLDKADLSPEMIRKISRSLDFSNEAAIVFFAGTRTTGGYQLELERVSRTSRELTIHIAEKGPDPDQVVTQALTFPHIVIVVKDPPPAIAVQGPQR